MYDSQTNPCAHCNRVKPREAFLPCKASSGGLTATCRTCIIERTRSDRGFRERRGAECAGGAAP